MQKCKFAIRHRFGLLSRGLKRRLWLKKSKSRAICLENKNRRGRKKRREEKTSMFGIVCYRTRKSYRIDRNDRGTISSEAQTLAALNKT